MLDEYVEGEVGRISPEAPVPVVRVRNESQRLGGAANVANSLAALGARVSLAGAIGEDSCGHALLALCQANGIGTEGVRTAGGRPTTRKLRVMSQRHQLVRMDWESTAILEDSIALDGVRGLGAGSAPVAIVISDYAKGFLTPRVLQSLIAEGRERGVPVIVDPKRPDYAAYRGATVLTPNLREFREAVGDAQLPPNPDALARAAEPLLASTGIGAFVITLGELGMVVVRAGEPPAWFPAIRREVFDVTGAGDAVVTVLALSLAAGADLLSAARLANVAGSIAVSKVGAAVIRPDELLRAVTPASAEKVHELDSLGHQLDWWRTEGRRIVFTNGCFDVLHVGHLSLLRQAAAQGDVLVVGINSDASVGRLKGPERPLMPQAERAALLAGLDCVNAVAVFDEDTPLEMIRFVRPDVLVKGADYRIDQVVGRDLVEAAGGKVVLVPLVPDRSTSGIVARMKASGGS
jgi:D-beta-D-heptose 7-phosphate kinase/D-beta-D-heptose 1-phosphate adenosyltransferase